MTRGLPRAGAPKTENGPPGTVPALSARSWVAQADFLIHQSEAVQLARVDAFLEGVTLAAEQVQDVRIRLLETPAEVTGWSFYGEVLLTLVLESTVAGKVLAKISKRIFSKLLEQNAVFLALPKAPGVGTLRQGTAQLSGARLDPARLARLNRITVAEAKAALTPLAELKPGVARDLKLYHASIQALVSGGSEAEQNLAAVAKAAKVGLLDKPLTPRGSIAARDSVGVAILAAAQDYASVTRMGIRVRHARVSSLLVSGDYTPEALIPIVEAFGWEDLLLDVDGRRVACNLSDLRGEYALLFEAVIWARLYGFDASRHLPHVSAGNEDEFTDTEIRPELVDYWFSRFGPSIDRWNEERRRFPGSFATAHRCRRLRDYFWDLVANLPRLREGQLSERVPIKPGEAP